MDVEYLLRNIKPPSPLFYVAQRSINFVGDESFPAAEDAFDFDNSSLFGDLGPAALVHTKKYVLNLKFESKSWQYSWKSTRCTKETKHAFIVSVLSPASLSSSPSSPSSPSTYFSESSDHSSIAADHPHAPQHLRRLLQRASKSFTVSCVRRSDRAKQITKHEKSSVKSIWLQQGTLDQTSARQFTPCILPQDLPLSPLPPQRDEEDEEHSQNQNHNHNHHHCHAHQSRRSLLSSSSSSVTVEAVSIDDKRGSDYLFYGDDDRLLHDVHNTLKNTKTNELAGFSPTLEAAYRSVFGYSA